MADATTKAKQLQFLTQALGNLPVTQVYIPDCEGDDVVAWLVKHKYANTPTQPKIIVSSDRDFFQLMEDPSVKMFDPIKKVLIDSDRVMEQFGVSPRNFCLAKTIVGDNSDNIPGVPGVGFKTAAKRFGSLLSSKHEDVTVDQLLELARQQVTTAKKPAKCYQDLLLNEHIIRRNWQLMYLDTSCFSASQIEKLKARVNESDDNQVKPSFNYLGLLKAFSGCDIPVSQSLTEAVQGMKTLLF